MPPAPNQTALVPKSALRKGEQTRLVLLAAARTVFAREGYLKAEISQITREAGKSAGVFYIYFENKDHLLRDLVDAFAQDLRIGGLDHPSNPPEDLPRILAAIWRTYQTHAATFIALTEAAAVDPQFSTLYQSQRRHAQNDFAGMIRARQSAGFCQEMDPAYTGMALETMLNYCLYEWLAKGLGHFQTPQQERTAFETLSRVMATVLCMQGEPA